MLEFVEILIDYGIQVSMDGKGRAIDNVFMERLWRSVKYEDIYLRDYCERVELHVGMVNIFRFTIHRDFTLHWSIALQ